MRTFIQESTLYPDLIQYLKEQGFDAIGETKFRHNQTRPDILFTYADQKFVLEVKLDDIKVGVTAIAQASRYAKTLHTDNFIVIIFPKKLKNQEAIDSAQLKKIVLETPIFAYLSVDKWGEEIKTITFKDLVKKLLVTLLKPEPTIDFETTVIRINRYVTELNSVVYKFDQEGIYKEVVTGVQLFSALGDIKNMEEAKKQVLHLASFLFFNQILFYHIFTKKLPKENLPELQELKQVSDLNFYLDKIQAIDYEAIYKINILQYIPNIPLVLAMINDIIVTIKSLGAEHITHDLAGRFFHDLIPHEVRKVLAAFYTHPNAADLLAGLLIDKADQSIIDPACGSGTLLVAAYKRKEMLFRESKSKNKDFDKMHVNFLEQEITGIDLMPFAAQISALNLTLQNIEKQTNYLRLATKDSLSIAPIIKKESFQKHGFQIKTYIEYYETAGLFEIKEFEPEKIVGGVALQGKGKDFGIMPQDVVIMNPPYSDREKMPADMQEKLTKNTSLNEHCGNLINLWGYFMILGDLLVKENGLVGSVIPINFARGQASEKIREFIFKNHTVRYLVKPVGDMAFSEGAAFKDILLITEKKKPEPDDLCKIVYFKNSIRDFANEDVPMICKEIQNYENDINNIFDVFSVTQTQLQEKQANLMHFLWASTHKSYEVVNQFYQKLNRNKLQNFPKDFVKEGFSSSPKGMREATFITNPMNEKSRIERAFMVLESVQKEHLNIRLGKTDLRFRVPKKVVKKALRTVTGVRTIEIGENHDYVILDDFKDFTSILRISRFENKKDFKWNLVQNRAKKQYVNLLLAFRFNIFSVNTTFISFYSEEYLIGADAFKVIPNIPKEKAKILCMFFNSIINICQILTNQQGTTGQYGAIRETDLLEFQLISYEKLTEKEIKKLLKVFDSWRSVPFPSIVSQIESRFAGRVAMDTAILEVLGYNKSEIKEILPELYEVVLRELKQDF